MPEKTHSRTPGLPPGRRGRPWPPQPAPPDGSFIQRWALCVNWFCFVFFSIEPFLCFCSPSCLLESPRLYWQLFFFAARAPSFQEAILEVTFHCSSSLTSNRGPWKPLLLFLPCHSQASVGLSYSLFALKSQRPFPK